MPKVKIDASNPALYNSAYRPFLTDQRQTQIFFGGSSSGKSNFILGQRTVLDLLAGGRNFLICRNVGCTNRDSTFNELLKGIDRMGLMPEFRINKSDMTVTCQNGYQAIFKGLDDLEKVKSVTPRLGVLTDIIIEEATETSSDKVRQLRKRMRGESKKSKRMTFLFNPVYKAHWIYKDYFAGRWDNNKKYWEDDRTFIIKTTYKDNKFLGPDEIWDLENEQNAYFRDVYTLGNWGVLGAVIFTNWRIEDLSGRDFDYYRNGLDFGYTTHPSALVVSAKQGKTIYIKHGRYYRGMVNDQLADVIKPILGRDVVKCDSANPRDRDELRLHKINAVSCKKIRNGGISSILHGIQWLQGHEIVVDKNEQDIINELSIAQWDKDKNGNVLPRPVDRDNHCLDALRYSYDDEMNVRQASTGKMPF